MADTLDQVLTRFTGVKRCGVNQYSAKCPAHDDSTASLSISAGGDGRVVLHCHAGCPTIGVVKAVGLKLGDLFPPKAERESASGKLVATYDYCDADGVLVYQVCRYTPKSFKQRRPSESGGWTWDMAGVSRLLYRLPAILAAAVDTVILIVEGEKDADNLTKLGFVATCNSGGAGKWQQIADDSTLDGRHVVVIRDRDLAGRKHAGEVDAARREHSASVRHLELPGDGKDASDWLANGGTTEQLRELIDLATEVLPLSAPPAMPEGESPVEGTPEPGQIDPISGKLVLAVERTLPTVTSYLNRFHSHPERLTLTTFSKAFMGWQGGKFSEVEDGQIGQRLLHFLDDSVTARASEDGYIIKPFPANDKTVKSVLESIRHETFQIATDAPVWIDRRADDPDPLELVMCKSMLIHLPTMRRIPATPRLFNVTALDYDPQPNETQPAEWLKFLDTIFLGDDESIEFLQEWFGYCLTCDTRQQKICMLIGPRRSGKGTIGRVLTAMLGAGSTCNPTTSSLSNQFGLQPLVGKSLAIISDARFSGPDVSVVVENMLNISGEDSITVNRKFLPQVTLRLPTRFMIVSNVVPRLIDAGRAFPSRCIGLRLTQSFLNKEDHTLTKRLMGELSSILNWSIEGWRRLNERGHFIQPGAGSEIIDELENLSSPLVAFLKERCVIDPAYSIPTDDLYTAWREWCEKQGSHEISRKDTFGQQLLSAAGHEGVAKKRNRHSETTSYHGLTLIERAGLPISTAPIDDIPF